MAKQSENREGTNGVKHLYRVWSRVDSKIELPAGLTARALLPRLDNVEQPVAPIGKIRFSPKIFTWQSGVTYAAAFALILVLSSVLTRDDQTADILHGEIAAAPGAIMESAEQQPYSPPAIAVDNDQAAERESVNTEQGVETFAAQAEIVEAADEAAAAGGIGGQSKSKLLGKDDVYTYTWRANDPTDPDKQGFPITVNIMETESGELAAVIDIPDMETIREYYVYQDIIAFVGSDENSAMLYAWDLSQMESPEEYFSLNQQGVIVDTNLYNNTFHLLSVVENAAQLDCEVIPLPGSVSDACCVVTVVDLDTGEVSSKAFLGVDTGDISLFNLHAYLNYDGEATESNPVGKYVAQIRLDGMSIELAQGFAQEQEESSQEEPQDDDSQAPPETPEQGAQ